MYACYSFLALCAIYHPFFCAAFIESKHFPAGARQVPGTLHANQIHVILAKCHPRVFSDIFGRRHSRDIYLGHSNVPRCRKRLIPVAVLVKSEYGELISMAKAKRGYYYGSTPKPAHDGLVCPFQSRIPHPAQSYLTASTVQY
ncbi:hypothetical protein C8R44DRAFT_748739 [Mycena epipterygia]|nr:hypothetical protein C8R44DRAFT_748739 [Mycena epipterygia]